MKVEDRISALFENAAAVPVTFEVRIANTKTNAREIADLLERELAGRIVYLGRARLLISLARDANEVMARAEAAGVESDFSAAWHELRQRLIEAQQSFERIIAGNDAPNQVSA